MKKSEIKVKEPTLRVKLAIYFWVFILVMLILLWLFQVVLLESFYKSIKTKQIEKSAKSISNIIEKSQGDQEFLHKIIDEIGRSDINVTIFNKEKQKATNMYMTSGGTFKIAYNISGVEQDLLNKYYVLAEKNNGTITQIVNNEMILKYTEDEEIIGEIPNLEKSKKENLVYAGIVNIDFEFEEGETEKYEYLLFITSVINPVDSTVETIRFQLTIITAILVLFAIALAIYVSSKIAKPITDMNDTAKEFAKHNYNIKFKGKGYKEVSELADTLNYASTELSKVDKLHQELIANISHDLRTPLTMIIGYGEAMRDLPGENTPENIQIIIDEASYLSKLVTDLLDLSQLQSGAVNLTKSKFSISQTIGRILLRYSKLKEKDGYNIGFEYEKDVYVLADELKISQVIYNLVNNAINYSGEDKTVIVRQVIKDKTVRIEIEDHGNGIKKDKLEHIWDRYYKVDKTHKSAIIGTGLGLSIVKNMLDLHGAKYGVISKEGIGSIFWFELKIAEILEDPL